MALPPHWTSVPMLDPSWAGLLGGPGAFALKFAVPSNTYVLPAGSKQVIPGSSWGTFTIACTCAGVSLPSRM